MDSGTLIALSMALLQEALGQAKANGAAPNIIDSIDNAIKELLPVHGTPVTFAQLEGLRTQKLW